MNIRQVDNIQVLEWSEDITLTNGSQFKQELLGFVSNGANQLILSLKDVHYINSAGLGVIADAVMKARKDSKELVIANIQESIHEVFEIVKFGSFIKLFSEEASAIEYLQEHYSEQKEV